MFLKDVKVLLSIVEDGILVILVLQESHVGGSSAFSMKACACLEHLIGFNRVWIQSKGFCVVCYGSANPIQFRDLASEKTQT